MLQREQLHEYQRNAVQIIKDQTHCGLFMRMGLGKTIAVLTAIADLTEGLDVAHVLVIAPFGLRIAHGLQRSANGSMCSTYRTSSSKAPRHSVRGSSNNYRQSISSIASWCSGSWINIQIASAGHST